MERTTTARRRRRGRWGPWLLLAFLLALFVIGSLVGLGDHLGAARRWIHSLGIWGPFAFIGLYALAVIVAVPASALAMTGGFLFGWTHAVAYVSVGAMVGASASFLLARYVVRDAVQHHIDGSGLFNQLNQLTATQGPMVVGLLRLVPIFPFFLMNYGLGLTRVRFSTYLFWSWLGMLPTTVLWALGGDSVTHGLVEGQAPLGQLVALAVLLVALAVVVTRTTRRLLSE